jgi:hypothetical protein
MSAKEQTERIVKAIANPHTTILGHVTGRQLLRRPGYEVDMERILQACAKHGVAVEINAHPWRLDMDWRWCARALELGCLLSIDPDAHSTDEIDNMRWGILMARKGAGSERPRAQRTQPWAIPGPSGGAQRIGPDDNQTPIDAPQPQHGRRACPLKPHSRSIPPSASGQRQL